MNIPIREHCDREPVRPADATSAHDLCRAVAHDLNNLFTSILGNAELLVAGGVAGARARTEIVAACRRAQVLLPHLLAPADALPPAVVDLADVVRELAAELRDLVDPRTTLEVIVPEEEVPVLGLRRDLEQILFNLVLNAYDATGWSHGYVRVALRQAADEHFELEVSDDGCGIPAANVERVFDPEFTTKTGGTGLGLTLVADAVERLSGNIRIDSSPAGTRVVVDLPRAPGA